MPAQKPTPDIEALAAAFHDELLFGQVLIRRTADGFELRHVIDSEREATGLRLLKWDEIRPLAQFTANGAFRPLKSAPNLASGWSIILSDNSLGEVLDRLYPGAVADWFAAQRAHPPVTSYREFTSRQTGMYRITTHLDDTVAGAMVRACCHPDFCMKRRLWSVDGLAPDKSSEKSVIPCLEPCAILLEFARKVARLEQQEPAPATENSAATVAECDFDAPNNPRRLRFVLEKQHAAVTPQADKPGY